VPEHDPHARMPVPADGRELVDVVGGRLRELAPEARRCAIGVSGGGDSVALAWMLAERGVDLVLLHVDHALRPEAEDDADFVRDLAAAVDAPFRAARVEVRAAADRRGWNLEEAARRLRRSSLHRMARAAGADVLLLAHTVDDQAETVVLQALRGSAYLRGMAARRGRLVRPLLTIGRGELRAWLDRHGRPWRDDPTNADLERARAWVRHAVLPRLESYAPGVTHRLARLAAVQRDAADFVREEARRRVRGAAALLGPQRSFGEDEGASTGGPGPVATSGGAAWVAAAAADGVDARALARQPVAVQREVLAALLAVGGVEVDLHRIETARAHLNDGDPWRASVGAGAWWRIAYGRVAVVRSSPRPAERRIARPEELPDGVGPEALARGPLELRARRPGDVVRLPGGHRSLADVLIDARVPREARDGLRLLARGDEVVWVEGLVRPAGGGAVLVEDDDERAMREALSLARAAGEAGELPVGALVLRDGEVLGRGANRTRADHDPTAHAEVLALRAAAAATGDWRLTDATLVVTLEPCPMCFGAALTAHVARVVYGAPNLREGALGGVADLGGERWKRRIEVRGGVRARESAALLASFFAERRG